MPKRKLVADDAASKAIRKLAKRGDRKQAQKLKASKKKGA